MNTNTTSNTTSNTIRINLHEDPFFRHYFQEGLKWGDIDEEWLLRHGYTFTGPSSSTTSTTTTTTTTSSSSYVSPPPTPAKQQPPPVQRKQYKQSPLSKKPATSTNSFALLDEE